MSDCGILPSGRQTAALREFLLRSLLQVDLHPLPVKNSAGSGELPAIGLETGDSRTVATEQSVPAAASVHSARPRHATFPAAHLAAVSVHVQSRLSLDLSLPVAVPIPAASGVHSALVVAERVHEVGSAPATLHVAVPPPAVGPVAPIRTDYDRYPAPAAASAVWPSYCRRRHRHRRPVAVPAHGLQRPAFAAAFESPAVPVAMPHSVSARYLTRARN